MGMVFGTRRRDAQDADDPGEPKRVPYRMASYEHDHEGKRFKSSNVVYSFWSASKYVLVLSLMLWWLPMFGQMIAGYVGGRRAGGPWKGIAASIVPVVCLYAVMSGFDSGVLPSHAFGLAIAPAAIGTALTHNIPFLSPYLQFSSDYVGSFVNSLAGASPYGINTYVLTVAFAYVGGVLAQQNRREIEFTSGSVTSSTTVLVHNPEAQYSPEVPVERPRGAFASIGALLHLPGRKGEDAPASGGFMSRRRDAWAHAAEMRYDDDAGEYGSPARASLPPVEYDQAPRRHHHSHHHQKRRGAPNYSAKVRFNYPQFETPQRNQGNDGGYRGGMIRRSKDVPRFKVTSDPRSIKKAHKLIDHEWGRAKRYDNFSRYDGEEQEAAVETEAAAAPHRKEHHTNSHQWDSI
jgi:hypothetical protein